jgi:hypothetical protein
MLHLCQRLLESAIFSLLPLFEHVGAQGEGLQEFSAPAQGTLDHVDQVLAGDGTLFYELLGRNTEQQSVCADDEQSQRDHGDRDRKQINAERAAL